MSIITQPPLQNLEEPWKEYHDVSATQEAIKQLLAGGTPDWVRFPHEFKDMAREAFAAEKEYSDRMAEQYKWPDQDTLTKKEARCVNQMSTLSFIDKIRKLGVKCFFIDNGYPPQSVALWAMPPNRTDKARYICWMQVPAMYEWSLLRLDRHGIPNGEDYRGWRTILAQLILKDILPESAVHQAFGMPAPNEISLRYYRTLWEKRHGKPYEDLPED